MREYLRGELIELARRPDPVASMGRVRDRNRRTASRLSADHILSHHDADRR